MEIFKSRTALMVGEDGIKKLNNANILLFGLGGVGSYAFEGLIRAGITRVTVVDSDEYSETNINRQLYATTKTIGKLKTKVASERAKEINPNAQILEVNRFILPSNISDIDFTLYDYVIDAIDTVSTKVEIAKICYENGINLISSMGTGNKLDPTLFKVADIKKTKVCPLCKVMRKLLKENGVEKLKVVYSEEEPVKINYDENSDKKGAGYAPASISFVPSVAGLIIAGEVIKDLIKGSKGND